MLTCESPSQLFVQLLRLKCETNAHIKYFGYDRACEFRPFLANLRKKGNEGAKMLLEETLYLVDRFHIKGHISPKCDMNNPQCSFHPDLPKFAPISGVNTECGEQCFSWLGKFKHSSKYMTHYKFKYFFHSVVAAKNRAIEKRNK